MKRYILVSRDPKTIAKIKSVIAKAKLEVIEKFPNQPPMKSGIFAIVDLDLIPSQKLVSMLTLWKKHRIPLAAIASVVNGQMMQDLLQHGILTFFFKEWNTAKIHQELRKVVNHFQYYQKIQETLLTERRIRCFLQTFKDITSDKSIDEILFRILRAMKEGFGLQRVTFYLAASNRLKAKMSLSTKQAIHHDKEFRIPLWLRSIIRQQKPVFLSNKHSTIHHPYFTENSLVLPIIVKTKFLGLIHAVFPVKAIPHLSPKEVQLLKAFAEQTAVALENARLYWDILQAREELVAQEKKALLGQMIVSLNHEINNPLSIISMETQMLLKNLPETEDKIEQRLEKIENSIERIKTILEKISALDLNNKAPLEYAQGKTMLDLVHDN